MRGRGEKRLEGEEWGVRENLADSQNTVHARLTVCVCFLCVYVCVGAGLQCPLQHEHQWEGGGGNHGDRRSQQHGALQHGQRAGRGSGGPRLPDRESDTDTLTSRRSHVTTPRHSAIITQARNPPGRTGEDRRSHLLTHVRLSCHSHPLDSPGAAQNQNTPHSLLLCFSLNSDW